jgi:hypothetical protein
MRNDCTTNLEMLGFRTDAYSTLRAPGYVLPSLARPGLFGD